ncbi:hypothetical protein HNV10_00885 [Winogradskyella litoriviva]|uniref:Uncharacterized protein n=1 Tax=Winogradskyella litoriviva TaxID=1220182 RepID=A0ABX2E0D7_9FLAO|nr:hypothetical protein [Winogradskyella litoriviva]NRD21775.1 hypothetical protein [Winogradskyella litoriviva]
MKTTAKILSALLICFVFTSCDDDILDVDFDTTVKATIVANVDQGQETVNESVVLSLDNNDTHDYLDKIKDVTIKKLTYRIISFSGDSQGSVDIDFYADNITLQTEAFVVNDAYNSATVFEVTDISKLNTMANMLKNNNHTTVGITGNTVATEGGMNFNIEVTAELEITANPL